MALCLGVTHALRTNEYRDRLPQYKWMLQALNLRDVEVWDFRYGIRYLSASVCVLSDTSLSM